VDMRFAEKSISADVFKRKQATRRRDCGSLAVAGRDRRPVEAGAGRPRHGAGAGGRCGGGLRGSRRADEARLQPSLLQAHQDQSAPGRRARPRCRCRRRRANRTLCRPPGREHHRRSGMAWVKAVQGFSASNTRKRPQESREPLPRAFSDGDLSIFFKLAERAGFEPAMEFDPHTRLAGECLQPLGHLSWDEQASLEAVEPCRASA
jgi:hypothetical protein